MREVLFGIQIVNDNTNKKIKKIKGYHWHQNKQIKEKLIIFLEIEVYIRRPDRKWKSLIVVYIEKFETCATCPK